MYRRDEIITELRQAASRFEELTGRPAEKITRAYFLSHSAVSEKEIIQAFGSWLSLKREVLYNQTTRDSFNDTHREGAPGIYVITAAVAGADLHTGFTEALQTYCRAHSAELIVLPMRGVRNTDPFEPAVLRQLQPHMVETATINPNLQATDLRLSPQQVEPLSGIDRLGRKEHSLIIAHPKQHLRTIPSKNTDLPHLIMSTGTCTIPLFTRNKSGILAEEDYQIGALVVESDGFLFHVRHIQAMDDGSFYDLNRRYTPTGVEEVESIPAVVWGDLHIGQIDYTALSAAEEITKLVNPDHIIIHDYADMASVNHHESQNLHSKSTAPTLQEELAMVGMELSRISDTFPDSTIHCVASNHPEFLKRYVETGRYVEDPINYRTSLDLAIREYDTGDGLADYLKTTHGLPNVIFHSRRDDLIIEGIQLAEHGDKGSNGSRGSTTSLSKSYGNSIIGHSHSPKIEHGCVQVGCLCILNQNYNEAGQSSWLHNIALVYPGGGRTFINIIEGLWKSPCRSIGVDDILDKTLEVAQ